MDKQRTYFCIDMKTFYASVECAERGLNPFNTNLVVADPARGKGAICLAISPKLKAMGIKNRCRLYEIPENLDCIIAKPRMKKYIEYAADIYEIYLDYVSKDDIHVYSIDEAFLDVTDYLPMYKMTAIQFAQKLMNEIAEKKHIPSTAGIGTNMYLAKIALDITAKHSKDHIGYLDEEKYKKELWDHKPITDFWQVARGISRRLEKYKIYTMRDIANENPELLYNIFGVNAELLIDHAWGREPCIIADIKAYKSRTKSVSTTQILFKDYDYDGALLVLTEMTLNVCEDLIKRHVCANNVAIQVRYSKDLMPSTGGSKKMGETTSVFSIIREYVKKLYEETTYKDVPIRGLGIFLGVVDEDDEGYNLFTNYEATQKEKKGEMVAVEIKEKYGKNAILRAMDLKEEATQQVRNKLVGGHNGE